MPLILQLLQSRIQTSTSNLHSSQKIETSIFQTKYPFLTLFLFFTFKMRFFLQHMMHLKTVDRTIINLLECATKLWSVRRWLIKFIQLYLIKFDKSSTLISQIEIECKQFFIFTLAFTISFFNVVPTFSSHLLSSKNFNLHCLTFDNPI